MLPVTAFILAGGRSRRMGSDKAFLRISGLTLLERALRLALNVSPDVHIVGDASRFAAYGHVVEDIFPGHGPLGGIHAALCSSATDYNLVIGTDLPFLTPAFLRWLVQQAQSSGTVVTIPSAGGLHPLCAVYRREFRVLAEPALKEGRNKIDALFASCSLRTISATELESAGFPVSTLCNVNTPEDWELAKQALSFA